MESASESGKTLVNGDLNGEAPTENGLPIIVVNGQPMEDEQPITIEEFCARLRLPERVSEECTRKWNALNQTSMAATLQDNPESWYTVVVYMAAMDIRLPYGRNDPLAHSGVLQAPCTTVSDLIRAAHINMLQFCQMMNVFRGQRQLSEAVLHHFVCLERKYLISLPLFNKFERSFNDVFLPEGLANSQTEGDQFCPRIKLCWALFVYVKAVQWSGSSQGLIQSWYLLLCCVAFTIKKSPSFQLKAPFDAAVQNSSEPVEVLETVCGVTGDSVAEVKNIYTHYFEPVLHKVLQEGSCDYDGLVALYTRLYLRDGDINELLFLSHDPCVCVRPSNSREQNNNSERVPDRSPVAQSVLPSPAAQNVPEQSPAPQSDPQPPMTPVQAARNSAQQLRNMLSNAGDQPSLSLVTYFQRCSVNPSAEISARVSTLKDKFVKDYMSTTQDSSPILASQCFTLATRLYYRVMETMLKTEEARLSVEDFSALLNKDVFHRCLLACSVVVVMETDGMSYTQAPVSPNPHNDVSFPWILTVFSLKAYDFFKVPESFIKAEPRLPKDSVKTLHQVENRILESLGWELGSPLYDALACSEPWRTVTVTSSENPTNTPAELYLSPFRSRAVTPNTVANLPQNSSSMSPRPRRRSHALHLFLNKACRLAHGRLTSLCNLLNLSPEVQEKVWTCMEHCITQMHYLLKNRHLDQIMMCCVYAVCKVQDMEKKFKTIVSMYKEMPHGAAKVYKRVFIAEDNYDSIICFYNSVFMHALKNYVIQLSSARTHQLSPAPKTLQSPKFSVPGRNNFYVSPMKASPFKAPMSPGQMTPRSRQLYCFGEGLGSAEKLRSINDQLKAMGGPTNFNSVRSKRLRFDQLSDNSMDEDDDGEGDRIKVVKRSRKSLQFPSPKKN